MGISAELLVGDKPITFDEFKATQTNHIQVYIYRRYYDCFKGLIRIHMENPIRLGYV